MQREIRVTADGSKTIYIPEMDETYHSSHGAIQEAKHVFIQHGLAVMESSNIKVLEIGFGTGLNALLSLEFVLQNDKMSEYTGIEAYPVSLEMANEMDYLSMLDLELKGEFELLHASAWEEKVKINDNFNLIKKKAKIQDLKLEEEHYDLIYFDAFGPRAQEAMWHPSILEKMFSCLRPNGVLVTYCAKGQVKRDLKEIGFKVEALPGPPGKREMTRAIKLQSQHSSTHTS